MSGMFLNLKSVDRKRVLQSLTENLCQLNVSVAYDGMQRHGDQLVSGAKSSDGTLHSIFGITIDMACLDGPPVMNITQLDDVVRKEFYEKKGVVYKVYIVVGLTNVSTKATAKMRLLVTEFYPGFAKEPSPEKRLITSSSCVMFITGGPSRHAISIVMPNMLCSVPSEGLVPHTSWSPCLCIPS